MKSQACRFGLALLLSLPGLSPVRAATVAAAATLVEPAVISAQRASEILLSPTPGVLTIAIPGAASAAPSSSSTGAESVGSTTTVSLVASQAAQGSGVFVFTAGKESAAALDALVENLSSNLTAATVNASLSTGLTTMGYIDGKGFQLVIMQVKRNPDGSGSISAIIPFD